jgi:hypothetical protein
MGDVKELGHKSFINSDFGDVQGRCCRKKLDFYILIVTILALNVNYCKLKKLDYFIYPVVGCVFIRPPGIRKRNARL